MGLKNKRVLITAGPTWVPIDSVRVISNISTGETGVLLAEAFLKGGAKVTLLLGPAQACCLSQKIKLINFRFFEELRSKIGQQLRAKKYDIIIHAAAVSDFKPKKAIKGKLDSECSCKLTLVTLPKIIKEIRRLAPRAILVMFKLESSVSRTVLIRRAKEAAKKAGADIIIANIFEPYRAFILRKNRIIAVKNKRELAQKLVEAIN